MLQDRGAILSYLGLKLDTFLVYLCCKLIGLTIHELGILNYLLKICKLFR